jgi:AraC-type DNA-binding domain-containing proteins
MRYIFRETEHPTAIDYYCEATQTTQDHFPRIPAHTHNYYEVYIFLNGFVKIAIEDQIYKVKYGDIMLIPPYTIHQLLPASDNTKFEYRRIYMYITEPCLSSFDFNGQSLLPPIQQAAQDKRYLFHIPKEDFEQIYQAMYLLFRSKKTDYYGKEMLNRSRIIQIITLLNKNIQMDTESHDMTHITPAIDDVFTYINHHYQEPLSLDFLANRFFLNKYTLSKLFKEQLQLTVHEYITLKRISTAKLLIKEGTPPSKVHLEVGYSNYSTFFRAFKKLENSSPEQFLAQLKNELPQ